MKKIKPKEFYTQEDFERFKKVHKIAIVDNDIQSEEDLEKLKESYVGDFDKDFESFYKSSMLHQTKDLHRNMLCIDFVLALMSSLMLGVLFNGICYEGLYLLLVPFALNLYAIIYLLKDFSDCHYYYHCAKEIDKVAKGGIK